MIKFTSRYLNIVSFIITTIIYIFLSKSSFVKLDIKHDSLLISNLFKKNSIIVQMNSNNINQETNENTEKNVNENPKEINEITSEKIDNKEQNIQNNKWKILIPKISLDAEISEGTSKDTMDEYVGHFSDTSKTNGNIGLAAHNRGYAKNYFSDIKQLREGDEIIYKYSDFEKTYVVYKNIIINDTDWSSLEETKENKITLITCVENEPSYRRCVQAIEKGGDTN